ncbi:glucose n-acetyltransferase [Colletotrichum truncatum]|uniref:Glucose n-acetyltransferase n=1 Tax=Colletotrichum truncatum TaxID=5467 RepID=A0ACC3ZBN7_COLTU|nr:glucose n-acetyltransferase [Colletotrichum truncatum]KAF6787653.1 glucose n-acetyltransferase [Colletotrichum truncatum]
MPFQSISKHLLGLPRRVQIFASVSLACLLLFSTFLYLSPRSLPPVVTNIIEASPWKPTWTTEQLEPRFAYVQYVTNLDYLCNAVINFGLLRRYGAKEDLVLIHPKSWSEGQSGEAKALAKLKEARPEINMRAFDVISTSKGDSTWRDSLTKFHAFGLTEWTRVLAFDSDSLVLNSMDHYFLSPTAPVAVPRAYWLNEKNADIAKQVLGSHVMLIEPNEARYHKIINEAKQSGDFDMEVINHMFRDSAMILPHRRLALLTGEFRAKDHSKYLAPDEDEEWNAMAEVSRSYLVHFSDWPLPKPWISRSKQQWEASLPECPNDAVEKEDQPRCANRVMWTGFYEDYDKEKSEQCKILHG